MGVVRIRKPVVAEHEPFRAQLFEQQGELLERVAVEDASSRDRPSRATRRGGCEASPRTWSRGSAPHSLRAPLLRASRRPRGRREWAASARRVCAPAGIDVAVREPPGIDEVEHRRAHLLEDRLCVEAGEDAELGGDRAGLHEVEDLGSPFDSMVRLVLRGVGSGGRRTAPRSTSSRPSLPRGARRPRESSSLSSRLTRAPNAWRYRSPRRYSAAGRIAHCRCSSARTGPTYPRGRARGRHGRHRGAGRSAPASSRPRARGRQAQLVAQQA